MATSDPQKALQALSDDFQSIQKDLSSIIETRQKLESQLQENKTVQKEFAALDEEAGIYKLIGPVLLKQDRSEAVINVDKRLEFIESEIKRVEAQIKDAQAKQEKKKMEIIGLQSQVQQQLAGAGAAPA